MEYLEGANEAAAIVLLSHIAAYLLGHLIDVGQQLGLQSLHLSMNPPSAFQLMGQVNVYLQDEGHQLLLQDAHAIKFRGSKN